MFENQVYRSSVRPKRKWLFYVNPRNINKLNLLQPTHRTHGIVLNKRHSGEEKRLNEWFYTTFVSELDNIVGKLKVMFVSFGCVNVILCLIGLAILGGIQRAGTLNFVPTQRMNKHLEK